MYTYAYEMGSRGRPLFDLNEPPAEDNDEREGIVCFQPQKTHPSTNPHTSDLFATSSAAQGIINNHAFSHASSVSGFQPFVRPKSTGVPELDAESKTAGDQDAKVSSKDEVRVMDSRILSSANAQSTEREEGEWSDEEGGFANANGGNNAIANGGNNAIANGGNNLPQRSQASEEPATSGMVDGGVAVASDSKSRNIKSSDSINDEKSSHASIGLE